MPAKTKLPDDKDESRNARLSAGCAARRQFLAEAGALTTGLVASPYLRSAETADEARVDAAEPSTAVLTRLIVNGRTHVLRLDPRVTLLDALREYLRLTGTKKGCDRGQCGACTVLVNGRRVNACLSLALSHDGDEVVTIEGLGSPETMHPMQRAFVEHDGFQCGYCTPGQVCSAVALVAEAQGGAASAVTPDVRAAGRVEMTDEEIRERMSGNLCRCGAYMNIVGAVRSVLGQGT
jgi:xanthine dehydrogenase YagT iron-sulfur-binding subunit